MLVLLLVVTAIFFACLAIYFSFMDEQKEKKYKITERENKRQVFELSLLSSITEKIGYSLNLESVAEIIALTAENLFDISTVSYAIRTGSKVKVKTITREAVGPQYLDEVSKIIAVSMTSIDSTVVSQNIENIPMSTVSDKPYDTLVSQQTLSALPVTYVNFPLIINNKLAGMINISSKKKVNYDESDVALLHKVIDTAQKAIEKLAEVIEIEESKLKSLILSLPSGTVMFTIKDNKYDVSVVNQAAKDFLKVSDGVDVAEIIGKFNKDLKIGEQIQSIFATKTAVMIEDVEVYGHHFKIFLNPVFNPSAIHSQGQYNPLPLLGVALIMRDITAEKKLEKVRLDFTDMMVHELRAPATAIRGAAALLTSGMLPEADREKMPRLILDSANDMLTTVSDFLDVAKIDEGKFKLNNEKRDLAKIISEHVDVFSYAAKEKSLTINFDKNISIKESYLDPVRIGQVINNLLSNSIKFTDNGGKIDITIEEKDGQISVVVLDNGIGVPEVKKPLLFTKFGQINQRLGAGASSGLGLFISRQIVEAHGGKIWLESPVADGHGTRVSFTLPIVTEQKSEPAPTPVAHLSN